MIFVPKKSLPRTLNAVVPVIAWATLIFIFSSQQVLPGLTVSSYDFFFKKSAHVFVYAVLYTLSFRAVFLLSNPKQKALQLWLPLVFCLLYAISDEWHQSLTPHRFPTARDVGYDMLGVGLAWLRTYGYV